jgi:hypothetical protein
MKSTFVAILGVSLATTLSTYASADAPVPREVSLYPGQPAPRTFVVRGAEVADPQSGLVWQRCSVGQTWVDELGCTGCIKTFSFDDAQRLGDGSWRLPTNFELAKIIDHGRAYQELTPTIDVAAFPDTDPAKLWYWTSTSDGPFVAWYVSFVDGRVSLDDRKFLYSVRLVRDSPKSGDGHAMTIALGVAVCR